MTLDRVTTNERTRLREAMEATMQEVELRQAKAQLELAEDVINAARRLREARPKEAEWAWLALRTALTVYDEVAERQAELKARQEER